MSRVQELPDDFDETLNLAQGDKEAAHRPNEGSNNTAHEGQLPALPREDDSMRSHTADDVIKTMKRSPLFMTSLDDAGEDGEENLELEAIRALQYEGTPAENALSFKEQGNEMVKEKRWTDAKEFYTKAIAVLSKRIGSHEGESGANPERDHMQEKDLDEACHVNRALCNLELKNYRSTTIDCASALRLNINNVKAYYRSASALLALDKIEEAADACQRGRAIDASNKPLTQLSDKITERASFLAAQKAKREQEVQDAQKKALMLNTALKARNIRVETTSQAPNLEDATIHLAPDPLSPTSALHFPVLLLYPIHSQSDFIKAFAETETVAQHLQYILPLPWDKEGEYTVGGVEVYVETAKGG
ncbi:uncharacterized protein KY384_000120 [Bacidia gigantensis]|uniref:uncharacterized protein n=1 Tax=Bacidia gigantensis TaxID=2732470 RepID=UPI001D04FC49|nr:uncharacterized protein KY384_000120 [Bacidia gigantensis]KAG8526127.1 hypothetical protein KY384_000120 [Bacidia gigantensis]